MKRLYECMKTVAHGFASIMIIFNASYDCVYALPKDPEMEERMAFIEQEWVRQFLGKMHHIKHCNPKKQ